jgi:hypothetical protein
MRTLRTPQRARAMAHATAGFPSPSTLSTSASHSSMERSSRTLSLICSSSIWLTDTSAPLATLATRAIAALALACARAAAASA